MAQFIIETKMVSDLYVQCSLSMPPSFRARCSHPAYYAVAMDNGDLMYRCRKHRDVQSINQQGHVKLGHFTETVPKRKEISNGL